MALLGEIRILDFLRNTQGEVTGRQVSDAKDRVYRASYTWRECENNLLQVRRNGSNGATVIPAVIPLDEPLVAFFGLYSGDGAKGSESVAHPGILHTSISFSQREPNLVKFAVSQFRRVFPGARFTFSLGEDSAYFMAGEGSEQLMAYYGGALPPLQKLATLAPILSRADRQYLGERRPTQNSAEDDLAFFYQFKDAMQEILTQQKADDIAAAGVPLSGEDRITASLRRPYKKGAREPGGSSRSDEIHVGNVAGMGELFLKILHEMETSILDDTQVSTQGLIHWFRVPCETGDVIDIKEFFETHPYGIVAGQRPVSIIPDPTSDYLLGTRKASKQLKLTRKLRITPLWCFTSGLYLAEGLCHDKMFIMFDRAVTGLGLGFTSSDNLSLELIIRALQSLFSKECCVATWKVKVGSQYFPELVVVGLKNAVPVLRGGFSGDGKIRTMEISIAIKNWALGIAPVMKQYQEKYSHVEPTGAGVPRVDFSASSSLCKWYFPLVMYAVYGRLIKNPLNEFIHD